MDTMCEDAKICKLKRKINCELALMLYHLVCHVIKGHEQIAAILMLNWLLVSASKRKAKQSKAKANR